MALTAMALLFGFSFVATKFALRSIPPFTLIFLRFSLASLFLGVIYYRRRNTPLLRGDRWRLLFASLIVPGLYFLAETYGLKLSSATSVSLLISTIPIFAALFAFLIMKEKIGFWRGVAIFLSVLGVAIIIPGNRGELAAWKMAQLGNLFGLGAAVCAGLYMAIGRNLMRRYSPLTIT
ncbi:MAG: DMT family transporter, partial [Thermodesulfobacteriota bacterium]